MSIEEILTQNKVIAIVGFSDNHKRPSNRIGRYLFGNGYKVYGVNPRLHGQVVDEINCYGFLEDLPEKADIVNVFRRSDYVFDLVKEILDLNYKPKVIWAQIDVISNEAKELAKANGFEYIENKCIMIEHSRI